VTGFTFDETSAADILQSLFHVGQAIARNIFRRLKTATVVLHGHIQKPIGECHADGHLGSLGVLDDIMHRLFHRQADVVPRLAGHLNFMRQVLHMKTAAEGCLFAQLFTIWQT